MNTYVIYKHTSPSGKSYIGQTNNIKIRNARHRTATSCRAFASAIKKYGWEAFIHEILLEGLTLEEANAAEQQLITEHNTLHPNGYNLLPGGNNRQHHPETCEMISRKLKGRPASPGTLANLEKMAKNRIGQPRSPDTIEKLRYPKTDDHKRQISENHIGKTISAEHKQKISMANKSRPAHNKGKTASDATRQKMSDAKKGKPTHNKGLKTPQDVIDRKTKTCPHCGKTGHSNMFRYHFDNCKSKLAFSF